MGFLIKYIKEKKKGENMYKIYRIVYEGKTLYVGKTKRTLKERLKTGFKFIPGLESVIDKCQIEVIEETDDASRERYWIEEYKKQDMCWCNTRRGCSGLTDPKEVKRLWHELNHERKLWHYQIFKDEINEKRRAKRKAKKDLKISGLGGGIMNACP